MPHNAMSNTDTYNSFAELARAEVHGIDYDIEAKSRSGSCVAVIAPHGGNIEPRTSKIARLIAGQDFSYYSFKGKKPRGNRVLHITSHRFDEPTCLELVAEHEWVVAIHGCQASGKRIFVGGRDDALIADLVDALRAAGFRPETSGHNYPGRHTMNVCNRGQRSAGVQFELSLSFRRSEAVPRFVEAVRTVLLTKQGTAIKSAVLEAATDRYLGSRGFNGLHVRDLVMVTGLDWSYLVQPIIKVGRGESYWSHFFRFRN